MANTVYSTEGIDFHLINFVYSFKRTFHCKYYMYIILSDADMHIAYFYQIVTFLVEIAPKVVKRYFELFCLNGESFEEFLNANKHLLFHLHHNLRCCQCDSDHNPKVTQYMSNLMFSTLFRHDSTSKVRSHLTKVNERVVQLCMCQWEPRPNLDVSILDLSLVNILMKTCFTSQFDANMWIKSILEVQNDIFHKSDLKSITLKDFESTWFQLDHAVVRLATLVSPQYNHEINHEATLLKDRDIKSKDKLNLENLCLEYWKLKCGDFEVSVIKRLGYKCINLLKKNLNCTCGSFDMLSW